MRRCVIFYRLMCVVLVFCLISCMSVNSVKPDEIDHFSLKVDKTYTLYLSSGVHEKVKILSVHDRVFTDSLAHTHSLDDLREIQQVKFSGLKAVGLILGGIILMAMIGQYLVEDTLDKSSD